MTAPAVVCANRAPLWRQRTSTGTARASAGEPSRARLESDDGGARNECAGGNASRVLVMSMGAHLHSDHQPDPSGSCEVIGYLWKGARAERRDAFFRFLPSARIRTNVSGLYYPADATR